MRLFRLTKRKYAKELSGKGASKSGNRWNSKGTEMIYFAESRALAMAEVAVHLTIATLPRDYLMIEVEMSDDISIQELKLKDLPDHWNSHPPNIKTQRIGDEFIYSRDFCVLKVPSAVVQGDSNFLTNPYHKQFKEIRIVDAVDFPFDKRIFK